MVCRRRGFILVVARFNRVSGGADCAGKANTQPTATATIDATTCVEQMQHANLGIQSHNFAHFEIIFENGEKQTHNLGKPMKLIFK